MCQIIVIMTETMSYTYILVLSLEEQKLYRGTGVLLAGHSSNVVAAVS